MKIAVTYENGLVFQHFGHSSQFKVYNVEDGKIISSELVDAKGSGHGALARLLSENTIDVLICGGLGDGAQNALSEAGIEVISGAKGDTDYAVRQYLDGNLTSEGVNCDHHHSGENEESEESGVSEGGCGNCGGSCGNCGGGCGGCGGHVTLDPDITGPNAGKTCRVHYEGTLNDGTKFDSSYDRGEPIEFVCGAGMMISGFDRAVASMSVGDIVTVHLMPKDAYGMRDPNAVFTIQQSQLPGSEKLNVGEMIYLSDGMGQPFPVKVLEKKEGTITFDANHEMAGKELNFKIELVEVK